MPPPHRDIIAVPQDTSSAPPNQLSRATTARHTSRPIMPGTLPGTRITDYRSAGSTCTSSAFASRPARARRTSSSFGLGTSIGARTSIRSRTRSARRRSRAPCAAEGGRRCSLHNSWPGLWAVWWFGMHSHLCRGCYSFTHSTLVFSISTFQSSCRYRCGNKRCSVQTRIALFRFLINTSPSIIRQPRNNTPICYPGITYRDINRK
ncbi:hypothetical protein EDB85DRAFT_18053 [Lactarius pseudohatsudake]|nr:hypothetical protein EDB85DRAFT_18053 [Lactarius pseudohatsudake]